MLLIPDIRLNRITDITVDMLKNRNITALLLDVDNTMSTHHGMLLTDGLTDWLQLMKNNGITLLVVSNSRKKRVEPFAYKIGLDFISTALKPLPFGFLRGLKRLSVKKESTAIVGDQIFTDIIGGNTVGINTILLTPIKPEEKLSFRIRRHFEKIIHKHYNIKITEE